MKILTKTSSAEIERFFIYFQEQQKTNDPTIRCGWKFETKETWSFLSNFIPVHLTLREEQTFVIKKEVLPRKDLITATKYISPFKSKSENDEQLFWLRYYLKKLLYLKMFLLDWK